MIIDDTHDQKPETAAFEKLFALQNAVALAFLFLVTWHSFRRSKRRHEVNSI